ncbi:MAG: nuclear transport factor 2 family protein [Zoogloeaceae bacterium]|jgi:ketosteroid isomerase-like protein|nr:nuclear transport factor 2 family protein [Zoogloeaceae bacterium]
MPDRPIYPTPQDAETAFYHALEHADLETMMSVWAEDEEIVCVFPGGIRLTGHAAIRAAWQRIFQRGPGLKVRLSAPTAIVTPLSAAHTVLQHVSLRNDESTHAQHVATNVFVRGALGWRLALHHVSLAPPDSAQDVPKVLH